MMVGGFDKLQKLYRDPDRGLLAGVCAGLADYFGVRPLPVRLVALAGLIVFFVPTVVAYLVLALALKPKPAGLYRGADEEAFWRGIRTAPGPTLGSLRNRFRGIEERLARVENLVASEEYELRRKFRDLEG